MRGIFQFISSLLILPFRKGKIFISYRRKDTESFSGRLYDHLVKKFGKNRVFMDHDNIEPGEVFSDKILKSLHECEVVLAIIGERFFEEIDPKSNKPRIFDTEKDFVNIELDKALI